jgi:hypothetical protein
MKDPRLDNLFREKLKAHQSVPPAPAWDRISEGLGRQRKSMLFTRFRVAAAILLLIVASWFGTMVWMNKDYTLKPEALHRELLQTNPQERQDETRSDDNIDSKIVKGNNGKVSDSEQMKFENEKIPLIKDQTELPVAATEFEEKPEFELEPQMLEVAQNSEVQIVVEYIPSPRKPATKSVKDSTQIAENHENTTVVVEYKGKEERKETPLKKVIEFAMDLKNGEVGLSDLRDAKDELLSGERKKEKQQ